MTSTEIKEKTIQMITQYQNTSEVQLQSEIENEILLINEKFCYSMAYKYRKILGDVDETLQLARVAMLQAIRKFDLEKGLAFTTLAGHVIYMDILKQYRFNQEPKRFAVTVSLHQEISAKSQLQDIISDGNDMELLLVNRTFLRHIMQVAKQELSNVEYLALIHHLEIPERPLNQKELSEVLGVSQVHISRMKTKALNMIRNRFAPVINKEEAIANG